MEGNAKLAFSSTISYAITVLFNAILVVLKEENKGIHDWLKNTFGHHWVGHGILTIIVFIVITIIGMYIFKKEELDEKTTNMLVIIIFLFTLISVAIIAGYFLMKL